VFVDLVSIFITLSRKILYNSLLIYILFLSFNSFINFLIKFNFFREFSSKLISFSLFISFVDLLMLKFEKLCSLLLFELKELFKFKYKLL
jgi:hypothetical protein